MKRLTLLFLMILAMAASGAAGCAPSAGASCALVPPGVYLASLAAQQAKEGSKAMLGPYQSTEGSRVLASFDPATYPGERDPLKEIGIDVAKIGLTASLGRIIPKVGGLKPSTTVVTPKPAANGSGNVATTATKAGTPSALPQGSFSIFDWIGYPSGLPKPTGPFRLLEGAEYNAARTQANAANRVLHQADPSLKGLQLHEIQPVKFGGSPTDPLNKIPLTPQQHAPATNWWNQLQRDLRR